MLSSERLKKILTAVENGQRFMDLLCTSAIAEHCSRGGTIFCAQGCSDCCSLAVNCTAAEALRVAETLTDQQRQALSVYIDKLIAKIRTIEELKGYLRMHRKELAGCPFLDHGSCGVYPGRPLSCRALLATRERRWCAVDFSEISTAEKMAFIESLDRSAVAFPMHYLAATQDAGQKLEAQASLQMLHEFGFSLSGNLPVLAHLFIAYDLGNSLDQGADAVLAVASSAGLDSPFLLQIETL